MGKRLLLQRRGKGSIFRAPKKGVFRASYLGMDNIQREKKVLGELVGFVHDPTNSSVLAKVMLEDGKVFYHIAAEGQHVGQRLEFGKEAALDVGNVMPLGNCVEGCPVFNIEKTPGDGGVFMRASGAYALIVTKDKNSVYVKFSSGKTAALPHECRATVGVAAGGGRKEKPMRTAGSKFHQSKAKRKKYPRVRGVAMNPNTHPFGGSQHHPGKSKSTSRHAPSGRKVGAIASKRTGRIKKN